MQVRFNPGWRVTSGNASISENGENLIVVAARGTDKIGLAYTLRNFALLSSIGAVPFLLLIAGTQRFARQSGAA